jgi:hypothetical protein
MRIESPSRESCGVRTLVRLVYRLAGERGVTNQASAHHRMPTIHRTNRCASSSRERSLDHAGRLS